MRIGIQLKATVFLVLLLAIVFGITTVVFTRQASGLLRKAADDQASTLFNSLEVGKKSSMERGELNVFRTLLAELSKVPGVLEAGLTDAGGEVKFASREQSVAGPLHPQAFRKAASARGAVRSVEVDDSVYYTRAQHMQAACLGCHTGARTGDLAGVLYVRYSLEQLSDATAQGIWTGVAAGAGGLVLASAGIYFLLGVVVRKPLDRVIARMKDVAAGDGDLTQRLPADSDDEMGEVARTFNGFLDNLQDLVGQIQGTAAQVSAGVDEILEESRRMLGGATEQSEKTQTAAASAEEMSATVLQVADGAHEAAEMAQAASQAATSGGSTVEESIVAMGRVEERVRAISGKVQQLGDRSTAIGALMTVIDDIADQTNLLALNAAIEAARAGEHGRGFAVVADEVRKLAEKTARATRQVSETVTAIRSETEQTVHSVSVGVEEAGRSADLSRNAGRALGEVVAQIAKNCEMVTRIATATQQQTLAVAEISGNLDTVAALARQVAQGARQTTETAETLGGRSRRLADLVGHFKA